jgi:hypothetical protein
MKIEIDDDFVDEIVEAKLLETYRNLTRDIRDEAWMKEDLEHFKEVVQGLELAGPWFVNQWDKKKKRKK